MRPRVFIAGPMRKGDCLGNMCQALAAFAELTAAGYAPMCPHFSFFVDGLYRFSHSEWLEIDLPWVAASNAVLRLPGESIGADRETELAQTMGIPVCTSIEAIKFHLPV